MKRIIGTFCVLLTICVLVLSSCASPDLDFDDAKVALEEKGYSVLHTKNPLKEGMVASLTASNDDDEYLYMAEYESSALASVQYDKVKLQYETEESETQLEIDELEAFYDLYEDQLSDEEKQAYKDDIEELEESLDDLHSSFVFGRSGCIIWYGTAQAVKDSK